MGRMQESKNYQTVLRAVAEIPPGLRGGWQVDILGDGPYRKNLEDLCASLGIEDCVRFRGWIENGSAEQLDYFRRASVFVSAIRFEKPPRVCSGGCGGGSAAPCCQTSRDTDSFSGRVRIGASTFLPPTTRTGWPKNCRQY